MGEGIEVRKLKLLKDTPRIILPEDPPGRPPGVQELCEESLRFLLDVALPADGAKKSLGVLQMDRCRCIVDKSVDNEKECSTRGGFGECGHCRRTLRWKQGCELVSRLNVSCFEISFGSGEEGDVWGC